MVKLSLQYIWYRIKFSHILAGFTLYLTLIWMCQRDPPSNLDNRQHQQTPRGEVKKHLRDWISHTAWLFKRPKFLAQIHQLPINPVEVRLRFVAFYFTPTEMMMPKYRWSMAGSLTARKPRRCRFAATNAIWRSKLELDSQTFFCFDSPPEGCPFVSFH